MKDNSKDIAISFLKLASSGKVHEAFSRFIGTDFRHHNPFFEGSADALMTAMQENAQQNPDKVMDLKHTVVEGEFVVVHSHVRQKPDQPGAALVHIFRIQHERIVELWDVGQAIPNESPNQYGMF
jgi:predicted SnoaL-like aldol condensation-catalyzing enzyme